MTVTSTWVVKGMGGILDCGWFTSTAGHRVSILYGVPSTCNRNIPDVLKAFLNIPTQHKDKANLVMSRLFGSVRTPSWAEIPIQSQLYNVECQSVHQLLLGAGSKEYKILQTGAHLESRHVRKGRP